MTHVSPPGVTPPPSSAKFSEEAFAAREERLRALMLQAQAGDEAAYRVLLKELSDRRNRVAHTRDRVGHDHATLDIAEVEAFYANALALAGAVLLTAGAKNGIHDEGAPKRGSRAGSPRKGPEF